MMTFQGSYYRKLLVPTAAWNIMLVIGGYEGFLIIISRSLCTLTRRLKSRRTDHSLRIGWRTDPALYFLSPHSDVCRQQPYRFRRGADVVPSQLRAMCWCAANFPISMLFTVSAGLNPHLYLQPERGLVASSITSVTT